MVGEDDSDDKGRRLRRRRALFAVVAECNARVRVLGELMWCEGARRCVRRLVNARRESWTLPLPPPSRISHTSASALIPYVLSTIAS